jgi:RimJ/RimL family protein N-acetyltransferase
MAAPARFVRRVILPSGRAFDLLRPRSHGVLDAEERAYCARANIPTGYDPAQLGWICLLGEDDIGDRRTPPSSPAAPLDLRLRVEQLRERFATIARPIVEQVNVGLTSPAEAEARLWTGADQVLDEIRGIDDPVTFEKCYTAIRYEAALTIDRFRDRVRDGGAAIDAHGLEPATASRFTFRMWEMTDVEIYRRHLDNPKLWEFVPEDYPSPFTEDTARVLIEASRVSSHHEVMAVELDGVPVGQVRLLFDDSYPGLNAAEVSYWIAEDYWGRSLGTKILRLFTHRGFRERPQRPLDLIYAWIRSEHAASIKTAERAGYRPDPFPRLSSFASEMRRAGCRRWIRFRSYCIAVLAQFAELTQLTELAQLLQLAQLL